MKRQASVRTDEDTIARVCRLAEHYPDTVFAGILDRQGRRTARGHRFEGNRVGNLRRHWDIPCFVPPAGVARADVARADVAEDDVAEDDVAEDDGELLTIKAAATALGVATSTIHRLIDGGIIIAGEQITPGAPWRIRPTDDLKARFDAEPGAWTGSVWLTTAEAETIPTVKRKMLAATSRDTVRSRSRTGKPTRQLKSPWTEAWSAPGSPEPLEMPLQGIISRPALAKVDKLAESGHAGAQALATYYAVQAVGLMNHETSAAEVVQEFKRDFADAVERLSATVAE